ncbi:hypothetical protein [Mesorhizobium sp. ES1-4]|uniref:hypothetical protein n=1 Tax=Mesorhizobium sp. ES1-4 TaxID=2876627 RepID=UPI001CCE2BDC|nr:hypothetical protein [Mesorhizobium sp. ES1-4]MBZ9794814.1 hypothetical protein [Mesorhizobium sp. ES1-4]
MNLKLICLATASLFALGGAALAGALDEPSNMAPFYADSALKQLKPMAEFKKVFMAMPKEKQEEVHRLCQDAAMSKPHAEFCADVNALAGS